jgi:archaemetzincin
MSMRVCVALVPIGAVEPELTAWLQRQLAELTGADVTVGEEIPLPHSAFEKRRGQYLGDMLLKTLRQHAREDRIDGYLLGLIDRDCYSKGLNYLFGQASLGGYEGLVALPRLRETFYSRQDNVPLFQERVLKEAMHELGHTWGLAHCTDQACVMYFSNSLHDTDVKQTVFCENCKRLLPGI